MWDGSLYVDELKQGAYHGQGTLNSINEAIDKGTWKQGKLEWQRDFDFEKSLKGIWKIN